SSGLSFSPGPSPAFRREGALLRRRIDAWGKCYSTAVPRRPLRLGHGDWPRGVERRVDERHQSLERGEQGVLARREVLDPAAESPASWRPGIVEMQDEGALYREDRSVLAAHGLCLLSPLCSRALSRRVTQEWRRGSAEVLGKRRDYSGKR